ncbi:hypothetical protein FIBSPDRAFT_903016 [Athelia psychrophila]|uniref:Uncharacterized protein n=1 Tax=Athelia psychrophila TaxID=1759441 RepID=A0A167WHP2_9AGAM|nr:hypothetical protein FIBSPDRAFT_903016 [Fibularhizoctonia sp. CBS 109695]
MWSGVKQVPGVTAADEHNGYGWISSVTTTTVNHLATVKMSPKTSTQWLMQIITKIADPDLQHTPHPSLALSLFPQRRNTLMGSARHSHSSSDHSFNSPLHPSTSHSHLCTSTSYSHVDSIEPAWTKEHQAQFGMAIARLTASAGFLLVWVDNPEWITFCAKFIPGFMLRANGRIYTIRVDNTSTEHKTAALLLVCLQAAITEVEDKFNIKVVAVVTNALGECHKAHCDLLKKYLSLWLSTVMPIRSISLLVITSNRTP